MKRFFATAVLLLLPVFVFSADHLAPGYLIPAKELETVYALQRAGFPVKEIREEIELDTWEITPLPGDRSARTLKKQTVQAKPGMFLLRTERLLARSASEGAQPRFDPCGWAPSLALRANKIQLLLPNQPVFVGSTRPLPEHTRPLRTFNASDLKLGRGGLAGEPMGDVTWLPDGEHWLQVKEGKLWKIAARTGRAVELFVDVRNLMLSLTNLPGIDYKSLPKQLAIPHYTFDPTFKAILLKHGKSNYIAFRDGSNGFELGEFEVPSFSPDGKLLAFVRDGNLHVGDLKKGKVIQLTTDGGKNGILNGRADWIYEEEIFHRKGQAYWWSPDSKQIAFLRFDDSQVPKFALTHNKELHSTVEAIDYPKPGDKNPLVKIGVVKVEDAEPSVKFANLDGYNPEDTIISRVGWVPGERPAPFACIQDRTQTYLDMVKWPHEERRARIRLTHLESESWFQDPGEPKWLKDGSFLLIVDREGRNQICKFDREGRFDHQVTAGGYDVKSIIKVSNDSYVHFMAKVGDEFHERHDLASIKGVGMSPRRSVQIDASEKLVYSPTGTQYLYSLNSERGLPLTWVRSEDLLQRVDRIVDQPINYEVRRFIFGKYDRTKIKTRDGFEMEAALTYPPDFDPAKKYPIWMLTYGGPNAPTIKDGWGGGRVFEQILAANGIVVLRVDPQSASGKGMVNSKVCYKQLGVKELQDLEDAVDWIGQKPWADTKRVGLSGHSFGGFLTAFALTHSKKFSAGIAGAPVTDWRLYDSIYTERYMGLPSENKEGYDKTSVIKAAKDLHGELLIVHGLIDDNVHAQNSLQLIDALQKAGKDFEVMVYPNDRHGIAGIHYPQTQLKFILRTMGVKKVPNASESPTGGTSRESTIQK